jgi:hypothetical protein
MKKIGNFILNYGIQLIGLVAILLLVMFGLKESKALKSELKTSLKELAEASYFEGQKSALEKDIRIKKVWVNGEFIYVWIRSPWDDGTMPVYKKELIRIGE